MDLIYFSPVPWNSIAQRPHFFIKEAINKGFTNVIWINPTPSRFPKISDLDRFLSPLEEKSFDLPPQVKIISPGLIPIEPFNYLYKMLNKSIINSIIYKIKSEFKHKNQYLVIGKPCLLAEFVLDKIDFKTTSIDIMDDFPCFFSGLANVSLENTLKRIIQKIDFNVCSSTHLKEKFLKKNTNSIVILNACDENFLQNVMKLNREFSQDKLIFGYVGTIASWFDWNVVLQLSTDYPESDIHIVGPLYSKIPVSLPKNVNIFPPIEHSKIAEVMSTFDFGLIPFKKNNLTNSVDPVKYYEYLAAGIPVISTCFGEMKLRIAEHHVHSFHTFSIDSVIKPESTVTWRERFEPFLYKLIGPLSEFNDK